MNKAKLLASSAATAAVALAGVAPAFAQAGGPFADVPTDHWAYSAVDKLQKAGVVIGYPDGTYGGKRAMTRYEFAVAIARLLDKVGTPPDLSNYYTKPEADAKFATKADLAGLATKEEVQTLRNLVDEFHTELTTLGVDLDATKKRLAALEGRVTAVENELKRVKVGGTVNFYGLGTNTRNNSTSFIDQDGFRHFRGSATAGTAGGPAVGNGNILGAARVMHDVDINIKARLSDTATAETDIVFGNYLNYLNSIASYSGSRTAASESLDQQQTIYKALVQAPVRLPGLGGVTFTVGRMPLQFGKYTFKQIDTDQYFSNDKTDLGNIPVDGGKAAFNIGPLGITAFGAKIDPIKYVSDFSGFLSGTTGTYGLYAGAAKAAYGGYYTPGSAGARGFGGSLSYGLPSGQTIMPWTGVNTTNSGAGNGLQGNGAMLVEQAAGARVVFGSGKTGTIGGTFLALGGTPLAVNPATSNLNPATSPLFDPTQQFGGSRFNNANLNRVYVYGGDVHATIIGLGFNFDYTKSDTAGSRVNSVINGVANIDQKSHDKITDKNDAYDAALSFTSGGLHLGGGYRKVAPYFGAPGYWDRVGSLTNPTDIEGAYAKLKFNFSKSLALDAEGQFYKGTGDAVDDGGLSTSDRINSIRGGLKFGVTSATNVDLGVELVEYKIGEGTFAGQKPRQTFYNIGYGFSFNPAAQFKLLYQIVDYDNKGTLFNTTDGKGGVAAAQFSVKF